MTDFAIINNDIQYNNSIGDIYIVIDKDSFIQNITTALKTWLGEYIFDISEGMPYETLFTNEQTQNTIDYYIRKIINQQNDKLSSNNKNKFGIKKINQIKYNIDDNSNTLKINIVIELNSNILETIEI